MGALTLGGLAATLVAGVAAEEHSRHARLERAAKVVEKEAKAELGHYQDSASPFVGWAELADRTKDDRVRQGFSENEPGLRDGTMQASIGHAVETHTHGGEAVVGSNDQNLVYFELGTKTQPPRSVLGIAAVHKEKEVVKIVGEGAVRTLFGPDDSKMEF